MATKKFDFNREQFVALRSKKLKELVGKNSQKSSLRSGFSEMYEDLLDGLSLSLLNEEDWRKLVEKKDINSSKLTDIYERKVHFFYEEKSKKLIKLINELVVSAYGKTLSSEKKQYSQLYMEKIKDYGKKQFLPRPTMADRLASQGRGPDQLCGSAKVTVKATQLRESSASADKNSDLKFRRFGKNRTRYKRVVNLILKYFGQVKDFAYKLNGHFYYFIEMNNCIESEGWFHFKSMVYKDLMKILFRDHKVSAFLSHLRAFFSQNKFYASRFKSVQRKLQLIDAHISAFSGELHSRVDPAKDGQKIMRAVRNFQDKTAKRKSIRSELRRIRAHNADLGKTRPRRREVSEAAQQMMLAGLPPEGDEAQFEFLKQIVLRCFRLNHSLFFQTQHAEGPSKREIEELESLSFSKLKSLSTLSQFVNPWFLNCVDCLNCRQRVSFVHFTEKLDLSLSSVNNIPRQFFTQKRSLKQTKQFPKQNSFQLNSHRISNPYSFQRSQLVQDHLGSPHPRPLESFEKQTELESTVEERTQTFKKRKRRKRRKRNKKCSSSPQKLYADQTHQKGQHDNGKQNLMYSLGEERTRESSLGKTVGQQSSGREQFKEEERRSTPQEAKVDVEAMETILEAMRTQDLWEETVKKLHDKRKRDERSRKKGQRRNRKLRMNEDLKATKAYFEWKEGLAQLQVASRFSAEGVWTSIQESLVIQKRF